MSALKFLKSLLVFCLACNLFFSAPSLIFAGNKNFSDAVNSVIGDISYIAKFGRLPNRGTNEALRIKTHLQFVEEQLRSKNVSFLSESLQKRRSEMLNLLQEYLENGVFPSNYDYKNERRPCFIDQNRNICAVGYL